MSFPEQIAKTSSGREGRWATLTIGSGTVTASIPLESWEVTLAQPASFTDLGTGPVGSTIHGGVVVIRCSAPMAFSGQVNLDPIVPVFQGYSGLCQSLGGAFSAALFASPEARRVAYFAGVIAADEDGRFRVGGADDDIEWLRDFWAFRHGEDRVSPVSGGRFRFFTIRPRGACWPR